MRTRSVGRPRKTIRYRPDGFVALSDPTRRGIIQLLARRELPVHEIADAFAMSRPAVSKHLRVLKDAGIVRDVVVGRERKYRFRAQGLDETAKWIQTYHQFWSDKLKGLGRVAERIAND